MTMLASEVAKQQRPFADGPLVRAIDLELLRGEFYRMYPADGDDKQKAAARQKAFRRAVLDAQSDGRICARDIGGVTFVWLASVK